MGSACKWHPITDLPDDPRALTDGELDSLLRVWRTQKKDLAEREVLDEFDRRLRREWAIETGIIEDVYRLDRGVTGTLIERGIDAAYIPHDKIALHVIDREIAFAHGYGQIATRSRAG